MAGSPAEEKKESIEEILGQLPQVEQFNPNCHEEVPYSELRSADLTALERYTLLSQARQILDHRLVQELLSTTSCSQHPFGHPKPYDLDKSVWVNFHPFSVATTPEKTFFDMLCDSLPYLKNLGVDVVAPGAPVNVAGGHRIVRDETTDELKVVRTSTTDGGFDPCGFSIEEMLGGSAGYHKFAKEAEKQGIYVVGDIVPAHPGMISDLLFRFLNYGNEYNNLFSVYEVPKKNWDQLPAFEKGAQWHESKMLTPEQVEILRNAKNEEDQYVIPGDLQRRMYLSPGDDPKNMTGIQAAPPFEVDVPDPDHPGQTKKKTVRYVYYTFFKDTQPSFNAPNPLCELDTILKAYLVTLKMFGINIVRVDANPFLAIERNGGSKATSEEHPFAILVTHRLGTLARQLGMQTFQEHNGSIHNLRAFSEYGADASYDFIRRGALVTALLSGDAVALHAKYTLMQAHHVNPRRQINGMQVHDEWTAEEVHCEMFPNEKVTYKNQEITGKQLRDSIRAVMMGGPAKQMPYNRFSGNGLCTTSIGVLATCLGIENIEDLVDHPGDHIEEIKRIKKAHLAWFSLQALQPGIVAISVWDLVGALPMDWDNLPKRFTADGDSRNVNRGAYDLTGENPDATHSAYEMPLCKMLYGSLANQLIDEGSFASQVKSIIALRKSLNFHQSEIVKVTGNGEKGMFITVLRLPNDGGYFIHAINFGDERLTEELNLREILGEEAFAHIQLPEGASMTADGRVSITIDSPDYNCMHMPTPGLKLEEQVLSSENSVAEAGTSSVEELLAGAQTLSSEDLASLIEGLQTMRAATLSDPTIPGGSASLLVQLGCVVTRGEGVEGMTGRRGGPSSGLTSVTPTS